MVRQMSGNPTYRELTQSFGKNDLPCSGPTRTLEISAILVSSPKPRTNQCKEKSVRYVIANYEKEWAIQNHMKGSLYRKNSSVRSTDDGSRVGCHPTIASQ